MSLWGSHTLTRLRMVRIVEHRSETSSVKTMLLEDASGGDPGQFVMIWVPGVDEFPMSLSYVGGCSGITYECIGEGTRALAGMSPGGSIGLRGPYGRGFTVQDGRSLIVAGGTGMACLAPFVEKAVAGGSRVDLVLAARTESELLFEERATSAGAAVHIATDDGSRGFKGLATELAEKLADGGQFEAMYACGPEKMISGLVNLAAKRKMSMQASLERFMKCGIGLCDSCALDGKHVCRDGPVFSLDEMLSFREFGRFKRDLSGRRVPI